MTTKNIAMKSLINQPTNERVETNEDVIAEKNSEVNEPVTELRPASQKTRFRENFENGMTVEEARKLTHQHIKNLWESNN